MRTPEFIGKAQDALRERYHNKPKRQPVVRPEVTTDVTLLKTIGGSRGLRRTRTEESPTELDAYNYYEHKRRNWNSEAVGLGVVGLIFIGTGADQIRQGDIVAGSELVVAGVASFVGAGFRRNAAGRAEIDRNRFGDSLRKK